jgi:hypothetical protein
MGERETTEGGGARRSLGRRRGQAKLSY